MVWSVCTPAEGMEIDGNVAVVAPIESVASAALAVGFPSRLSVTLPVGGTVPTGGVTTVKAVLTVTSAPAAGVMVEGVTMRDVELGWMLMLTGAEITAA